MNSAVLEIQLTRDVRGSVVSVEMRAGAPSFTSPNWRSVTQARTHLGETIES